jgi:hypothetical protein
MSATNRGRVRRAYDFYETPEEVTREFLFEYFEGDFHVILEPCAGSGKMVKVLRDRFPLAWIEANDIRDGSPIPYTNKRYTLDFLKMLKDDADYDLIFTNPPYSLAEEIITHALETWSKATVVMLLRLNFLGSQKRKPFWDKHPVSEIYVLSKRPSFTGKGTDATEYAWFVWRPHITKQRIVVI